MDTPPGCTFPKLLPASTVRLAHHFSLVCIAACLSACGDSKNDNGGSSSSQGILIEDDGECTHAAQRRNRY